MKPILLLDMDDTTADLKHAWSRRILERHGFYTDPEKWTDWNLKNVLPREEAEAMYEVLREPGFFRHLAPLPGAMAGIRTLHKHFHIIFLSKGDKYCYRDKHEWIEEHFPFLLPDHHLILTGRKDCVIGDYFVDDAPHNLYQSPARTKIVFDAPWNRHVTEFPRVRNWRELVNLLLSLEGLAGESREPAVSCV